MYYGISIYLNGHKMKTYNGYNGGIIKFYEFLTTK